MKLSLKLIKKNFKFLIIGTIVITSICMCFYKLGEPPLVRWDEFTNYGVITDTIEADNFFVLKYENSQTENQTGYFFEKPPLWYWLTEVVIRIGGVSNFNLRLVSAVSGVGVLLTIFWLGTKLASFKAGVISWLVALLTPHFFVSFNDQIFSTHTFKSADLDALQLLFIMLSLNFFFNLTTHIPRTKSQILFASLFSALAYLTKGPFGLLPAVLFFSFMLIKLLRKKTELKYALKLFGIYGGIFLLIAGSWIVFMTYRFGWDFINEYFVYHTLKRVATPLEGHTGNWFTYIAYFFNKQLFLFGEVFIISLIFLIWKFRNKIFDNFNLYFPIIGSLLVFTFLTFTQTKIAWYLFYLYPLACLIIGLSFNEIFRSRFIKQLYATHI